MSLYLAAIALDGRLVGLCYNSVRNFAASIREGRDGHKLGGDKRRDAAYATDARGMDDLCVLLVISTYGPLPCIRTPLSYNLPGQQCRHQRSVIILITTSKLRENIYRILDQVLETGIPVEIERRGKILKIVPTEMPKKLDNLIDRRDFVRGDPEDIVHLDWSSAWQP